MKPTPTPLLERVAMLTRRGKAAALSVPPDTKFTFDRETLPPAPITSEATCPGTAVATRLVGAPGTPVVHICTAPLTFGPELPAEQATKTPFS